jgi:hypothetical protein
VSDGDCRSGFERRHRESTICPHGYLELFEASVEQSRNEVQPEVAADAFRDSRIGDTHL